MKCFGVGMFNGAATTPVINELKDSRGLRKKKPKPEEPKKKRTAKDKKAEKKALRRRFRVNPPDSSEFFPSANDVQDEVHRAQMCAGAYMD